MLWGLVQLRAAMGSAPPWGSVGQPASLYDVTIISGRTSSKGVPVGSVSYRSPAQRKQGDTAAWFSWRFPAWCRGRGQDLGTGCPMSTIVLSCPQAGFCLTWVSQVLSLCSWQDAAGRQAPAAGAGAPPVLQTHQAGDLPSKQGMSPAGFAVHAGTVKSLRVHISGRCRWYLFNLRCPPGFAWLVRS